MTTPTASSPSAAVYGALAAPLWHREAGIRLLNAVVLAFVGAALLTLAAKVKVPFFPVPMTLQTLAVLLIGAAYGSRLGAATVALYLAEGVMGLPVFTNTPPLTAGLAYFLTPTGGFLLGFLPAAFIVGFFAERGFDRSVKRLLGVMLLADAVLMLCGLLWFAYVAQMASGAVGAGLTKAFAYGVQPFLLGEGVKIALAALIMPSLWSLTQRLRG